MRAVDQSGQLLFCRNQQKAASPMLCILNSTVPAQILKFITLDQSGHFILAILVDEIQMLDQSGHLQVKSRIYYVGPKWPYIVNLLKKMHLCNSYNMDSRVAWHFKYYTEARGHFAPKG